jgi:hypothetical protein
MDTRRIGQGESKPAAGSGWGEGVTFKKVWQGFENKLQQLPAAGFIPPQDF